MIKKFYDLKWYIKVILLLIPIVNWVIELVLRWEAVIRKGGFINIVVALIYTFIGWAYVLEILDIIWIALFNHLFLCDSK